MTQSTPSSRPDVIGPPSSGVYAEARRRLDAWQTAGCAGPLRAFGRVGGGLPGEVPTAPLGPGAGGDLGW